MKRQRQYLGCDNPLKTLVIINNEIKPVLKGVHKYKVFNYVDAYDVNGDYLGEYEKTTFKNINRSLVGDLEYANVLQIDYKFYKLNLRGYTTDEVMDIIEFVKNTFNPNTKFSASKPYEGFYERDFKDKKSYRFEIYSKPYEYNTVGYSSSVITLNIKGFRNFNAIQYKENLEQFIEKYPECEQAARFIYNTNIAYKSYYYNQPFNKISSGKYNQLNGLIYRMNININNKI